MQAPARALVQGRSRGRRPEEREVSRFLNRVRRWRRSVAGRCRSCFPRGETRGTRSGLGEGSKAICGMVFCHNSGHDQSCETTLLSPPTLSIDSPHLFFALSLTQPFPLLISLSRRITTERALQADHLTPGHLKDRKLLQYGRQESKCVHHSSTAPSAQVLTSRSRFQQLPEDEEDQARPAGFQDGQGDRKGSLWRGPWSPFNITFRSPAPVPDTEHLFSWDRSGWCKRRTRVGSTR